MGFLPVSEPQAVWYGHPRNGSRSGWRSGTHPAAACPGGFSYILCLSCTPPSQTVRTLSQETACLLDDGRSAMLQPDAKRTVR